MISCNNIRESSSCIVSVSSLILHRYEKRFVSRRCSATKTHRLSVRRTSITFLERLRAARSSRRSLARNASSHDVVHQDRPNASHRFHCSFCSKAVLARVHDQLFRMSTLYSSKRRVSVASGQRSWMSSFQRSNGCADLGAFRHRQQHCANPAIASRNHFRRYAAILGGKAVSIRRT